MPVELTPIDADPSGRYYSWAGIKNVLGAVNATVASQLEGLDTADLARVAYDGNLADLEVDRRASLGQYRYPVPIDSGHDFFPLVQQAADLYAAWLLVMHREWFENVAQLTDEQIGSLEERYKDRFDRLFGADPGGIEVVDEDTAAERRNAVPSVARADGSAVTAADRPVMVGTAAVPRPTGYPFTCY